MPVRFAASFLRRDEEPRKLRVSVDGMRNLPAEIDAVCAMLHPPAQFNFITGNPP